MQNTLLTLKRYFVFLLYKGVTSCGLFQNYTATLCYHSFAKGNYYYRVAPQAFEKQILSLKKIATFVSLDDAFIPHKKGIRIALTIDDGYSSIKSILPILKKHHIPATVFLIADPKNANRKELDTNETLLTIQEIKQLIKEGITIGCHSNTHADLSTLSEKELEKEIIYSKHTLEKKLHTSIRYFAYPKGIFTESVRAVVKKAGYSHAFTCLPGAVSSSSDPFIIPRTVINNSHSLFEFPQVISQVTFFLRKITNRILHTINSTSSNNSLKRPTLLNSIFIIISEHLFSTKKTPPITPKTIANYQLIHSIKKNDFIKYGLGLYKKDKKSFFIKTWSGEKKDIKYFNLINEYFNSKALSLVTNKYSTLITTPKIYEIIYTPTSLSLVFEFISGINGEALSQIKQKQYAQICIKELEKMSTKLSENEKKLFLKRSPLFILLSLPLFTGIALFENPRNWNILLRSLLKTLTIFRYSFSYPQTLSHRDLCPENMIIKGKKIYLLDLSETANTIQGYDKAFSDILFEEKLTNDTSIIQMLKHHIAIQYASAIHSTKKTNYFLSYLYSYETR